ncbi:MAG TPA: hypothetical protein VI704_05815, partial [Bacteroidota bacterium]|nr:hypothetical protein [Bacteroidota bacterium]
EIQWIALDQISAADRPVEFMVVLIPFKENGTDIQVSVRGPGHVLIKRDVVTDELRFNSHHPQSGSTATDAEFFMIQTTQRGQRKFWIVNGTSLTEGNGIIWKSSSKSSAEGDIPER